MRLEVLPDAEAASRRGARLVAEAAREAIAARGRFVFAASGGGGPDRMFRLLADEDVPWEKVHVFQVDERVAPPGPERNLTHLEETLLAHAAIPRAQVHAMPVEAQDLAAAAARYAAELGAIAGEPPALDLVQLGLGSDGHTASLVPGDPVLEVKDAAVATTAEAYQGMVRMTLTYPALEAARTLLWLVVKAERAEVLPRLLAGDAAIPAGRIRRDRAVVVASAAAAAKAGRPP